MSIFDLSQSLESINQGASNVTTQQMYPISGAINGAVIGQGAASGLTVFQFADSVHWWSPALSYFLLRLRFKKISNLGVVSAISRSDFVTYADNFGSCLFSQIQSEVNSQQLDICNQPWVIDQVSTVSDCKRNFLDTWGSMTRIGQPLMERINDICPEDPATEYSEIELIYKPPISIFSANLLPPGAQFKFSFTWATNSAGCFDNYGNPAAITIGSTAPVAGNSFWVEVNEFSFYKSTLTPSPEVSLPSSGVIDLSCVVNNQYYFSQSSQLQQNITFPGNVNKLCFTLQDANAATANDGRYYPQTSFKYAVCNSADVDAGAAISQFYVNLNELGIQMPQPQYSFDEATMRDYLRAYVDFCNVSQGTNHGDEGSIPFGSFKTAAGAMISQGTTYSPGNIANPEQFVYVGPVGGEGLSALTKANFANTAQYGYLGKYFILAFPVIRPNNKLISQANMNVKFTSSVKNAYINVCSYYNMAIGLERGPDGKYVYSLVEGV